MHHFFSDPNRILKFREVFLFTFGLMSDRSALIRYVYDEWIINGQKSSGRSLIESMFREAGLPVPKDLLHNQLINYYNHDTLNPIKDTTPVYVPSLVYKFYDIKRTVRCNIQHGIKNPPNCSIDIGLDKQMAINILSVCHMISQHQQIKSLYLFDVRCPDDLPEPDVFNLGEQTQSVKLDSCTLPWNTKKKIMLQINKCSSIREIILHDTRITGCLSSLIPDPHPGLPQLQKLNLQHIGLNKDDLELLSNITQSNKLPNLQELSLSWNTLTGCLSCFLQDPHPGLPQLQKLDLWDTGLNKDDLELLSNITQSNKLPNLQELNLSYNTLTGCLSCFLPDPHPGLPQLQKLNLYYTELNKDDLQHLTHLIQSQKLPRLDYLNLRGNGLYQIESELEKLIEACITHHKVWMELNLGDNSFSDQYKNKWRRRCEGTNIQFIWLKL